MMLAHKATSVCANFMLMKA